jgi:hypothetical protein
MSNATPETQTLTVDIQDELAVCLALIKILPLALKRYLDFDNAVLRLASDAAIEAMASMIEDNPNLFRETVFASIQSLAQVPNGLGRRGVSMAEAIAAFKGDGSCPDGVDPENWESLVQ